MTQCHPENKKTVPWLKAEPSRDKRSFVCVVDERDSAGLSTTKVRCMGDTGLSTACVPNHCALMGHQSRSHT